MIQTTPSSSEQHLRNALMFMPTPIGVTNSAGEIILFNEAFSATFGYTVDDMIDADGWFRLAYPDPDYRAGSLVSWNADVAAAARAGIPTPPREYRIHTKNGEYKDVLISTRLVEDLFVSTFEDITLSKRNEAELAQYRTHLEQLVASRTQELARKNGELETALQQLQQAQDQLVQESKLSSLGALVAGIAHELNTPIGTARMASTTLAELSLNFGQKLASPTGIRKSELNDYLGQVGESVELIERNIVRAANLIQSFKQVAVDRTSSQRRRFNLQQVADEVVLTLQPMLKPTPYQLETRIDPAIHIDGYPGPLGQVLVNLIENALKHGLEGRPHGHIRIAAQMQGKAVLLTVSDDGCGILAEHLPRVFDPFFTTRLGQGGSGLGLNIVFNIVNGLLGGNISADSPPGEGARFSLTLPLQAPQAKP